MKSASHNLWWGLGLGILLCLAVVAGLSLAGFHLMRHGAAPPAQIDNKAICWVSPKNPDFIRDKPGKDDQGNDLIPVYVAKGLGPGPGGEAKKERKVKYWVSPMDPGYVRDQPGKAPCGMDMVPVYEDEAEGKAEGTIAVDPNTLQSMGVRTAKVAVRPLARTIRAVGIVNFDERKLSVVTTKVNGWVDRLLVKAGGDPIRQGQPLLSIYSPELVSTQREYLLALKNLKDLQKSPFPDLGESARRLVDASRRRLQYWDISAAQIDALEKTGQVKKDLTLTSPATGIVIKRMVTQGQMVQAGMPLLEVADLTTVWMDAQIYEYELPWVKVGQHAEITLAYVPGETLHGTIQYIYPFLSGATRTARARIALPNPGIRIKPEMYGQVYIRAPLPEPVVVVPGEAVLDSGEKQVVFLALGKGRFEPREVKLGVEADDGLRQVLEGLKGGEEVVTSAQFLLDSESRIREAINKMLKGPKAGEPAPGALGAAPPAPAPDQKPAPAPVHRH